MKILFCDFLHWVYPKNKNELKNYLRKYDAECIYRQPCDISHHTRKLLSDLPTQEPQKEYRGFNVDSLCQTETTMEAGWYDIPIAIRNRYRTWVMYLIDWAYEVFEEERPDYLYVEGGLTYLSRPLIEVARELNIGLITTENSFIKDKIFIEFDTGYVVNRHSFARNSQDWLDTRCLTEKQHQEVDDIIENVFSSLAYQTEGEFDFATLKYKKTVFIPLQVYADQVTVYDSKYNNETFLKVIMALATSYFKKWNIILKCHPKEERNKPKATGDWLAKQRLPENITIIRGETYSYNTQELIKKSDLIFVNNSQAGLEACLLEKPVVVFGDAFYAKKGFTIDAENADWEKIIADPDKFVNIEEMKKWFYYFYKWLYNRTFTDVDKQRIKKKLHLGGK